MIALSTSNAYKTRPKLTYTERFSSYVVEKTVWFHLKKNWSMIHREIIYIYYKTPRNT